MRKYIYSLMTDERRGVVAAILKAILSAVSFFYGIAIGILRFFRIIMAKRLPCRVISVGNLTLGGTGKTPFACFLAKFLESEGHKPSVLIRGYGEDEWKMLQRGLKGIPVIVGRDRLASGSSACRNFGVDSVILDDGFQHWRLQRDLDIVLVDATDPFGNRHLFPRGILREKVRDLKRGDIIILTKTDMAKDGGAGIKAELEKALPGVPVLRSVHKPVGIYDLSTKEGLGLDGVRLSDIAALSSIVNTAYFEHTLGSLGANIRARFHYPDHHLYTRSDIERVLAGCARAHVSTAVTTEKDAVKLEESAALKDPTGPVRILVLKIRLEVVDDEAVLKERLRSLFRG